jgi:hypothetical protein
MATGLIRLPFAPLIVEGESFPSWVDRISSYSSLPLLTTMVATGLIPTESAAAVTKGYGLFLEPSQVAAMSWSTRVDSRRIEASLLSSLDGICVELPASKTKDMSRYKGALFENWAMVTGSHVCPACVVKRMGAWKLAWKVPWSFACAEHGTLLLDTCPSCGLATRAGRRDRRTIPSYLTSISDPFRCFNVRSDLDPMKKAKVPCGHSILDMVPSDLSEFDEVLEAQRLIDRCLAGEPLEGQGRLIRPSEVFGDLRALVALMRFIAEPEDFAGLSDKMSEALCEEFASRDAKRHARSELSRNGGAPRSGPHTSPWRGIPRSTALMAALVPRALSVLQARSEAELASEVSWLAERLGKRDWSGFEQALAGFHPSGTLLAALRAGRPDPVSFTSVTGIHAAMRSEQRRIYDFEPAHVPPMLPRAAYAEHFAHLLPGTSDDIGRRFCSMALVKCSGRYTWTEAAEVIGFEHKKPLALANSVVIRVNAAGTAEAFGEALRVLAGDLEASETRIDWPGRRQQLESFNEIPGFDWYLLCQEADIHRGMEGGKVTCAAAWLWSELTSEDWRLAPGIGELTSWTAEKMHRFVVQDLPKLERPLMEFGATLIV